METVVERERVGGGESTEAALRNALAALEESKREAACVAQEQAVTLRQYWQAEVESYKEQSQQHAITIVAMEERLLGVLEQQQQLQSENESLKQQLYATVSRQTDSGSAEDEAKSKVEELEQLARVLRNQLVLSSREKEEHQQTIHQLRKDIENRKHAEDNLRAQHSHEQEDMRQTLSSQENKVESQRQEVCKLREELEERQTELATMMEEKRKREQELTESCQRQLQTQLRETKEKWDQLIAVGERCLGEHHSQVLVRQKDTIAHIRERLQERDNGSKHSDGHEATLAELERVREELVEERALRHLEASRGAGGDSDSDSTLESDPVLDALQHSEHSYFYLVESVCEGGWLVKGGRPEEKRMPLTPNPAGRLSLTEERKKFAQKVAKRIQVAVKEDMENQQKKESTQ
ncbi:Forkhead-associated domain-containing protein 1 [Geodia barretti]|uniref:Forkhead-associated domain-containing protein 1 n=1 Tax=Geodia barretti TaxID=519541 RepID=A0AA35XBT9_GEOBA|nr:Forkhead-associated domain-containing protein 1 [Geodia barretti]